MRLLNKKLLFGFKNEHVDARSQIESWEEEIEEAQWDTPHKLKAKYPKASLIRNQHVVFNICGNRYRILVQISYKNGIVFIKKIGTHKEYDNWDMGQII